MEELLKELLSKTTGLAKERIKILKPLASFGDYCFACFELAKKEGKDAKELAQQLAKQLKLPKLIAKVEAYGGYLNFWINKEELCKEIVESILKEESYGSLQVPRTKALIEHTSINPNAPPHVGRIRNALIGDVLARLLRFHGYDTEVHYYVNDVSKQVALMLLGFKGDESFDELLNLYVRMSAELERKAELEKEVFKVLEKIEAQDKAMIEKMHRLVSICVKGQKEILAELGIFYDYFDYESSYAKKEITKKLLAQLQRSGRLKQDVEGRYYLDQSNLPQRFEDEMKSPVLVLTRSDGTGLYPLRDIAYTLDKLKAAPLNLIVLGEDQKLYFKQIAAALEALGYVPPRVVHYSYVLLKTKKGAKKMSTRRGDVVLVSDFIKEAVEKAKQEIKKRAREKVVDLERVAKAVAVGAIRYGILKIDQNKPVVFDWKEALSFEGNAGPYLQYSYVRACGILKRLEQLKEGSKEPSWKEIAEQEYQLVKLLAEFPKVARAALEQLRPSLLASYGYELSKAFNDFYEACPVAKAKQGIKARRSLLVQASKRVLAQVLDLLGIPLLEAM